MTTQALVIETRPDKPHRPATNFTVPVLLGPATFLVVVGLLVPLALMFRNSLNRYDPRELMISAVTLENYRRFFEDTFYQDVLFRTVWISALSTAICLIAAFPLAYFLVRYAGETIRSKLLILVIVPLLIGNAVRTAAWMVILNDKGMLAALLRTLGYDAPLGLMYSTSGVIIGLVSVLLPFMVITLHSVFEAIDRNLEDAATSLGASHLTVLQRITLPLALPGILAGTLLCFILSMNAYATPVLLGGPKFHMMAPTVYQQVSKAMNWPFGSALAFILMAATFILTITASAIVQRRYRRWTE